ncbi:MAG: D-alanyl-D-alanine carboxypeptidase/D-alanyl-D-alanine endopeptidase, partial [Marmoricola sp.]
MRTDTAVVSRRRWWWIGALLVILLALAAVAGLQWRYDWVESLPHSTVTRAAIAVPLQPPAPPVATAAVAPINEAAVAKALKGYLGSKSALGKHVDILVTGLVGSQSFRSGSGPVTPASTLKLLTAAAALQTLGPQAHFTTSVRMTGRSTIAPVGGGDPYLATKSSPKAGYPKRATLAGLAANPASYLKAHGVRSVRLSYDASLFHGPGLNPSWEPGYFTSDVIAPISALWTNEAHLGNGSVVANPPAMAAQVFASLLHQHDIKVAVAGGTTAPPTAPVIARVTSAPLVDVLSETLTSSDNFAAEVIARHVAIAAGQPATFDGAVTAIEQTLKSLGVPTAGLTLHDGSGLSRHDRLEPQTIAAILRLADTHPRLSGLLVDLPVAGFDGSLKYRFDKTSTTALGLVRAKTGTLTGVHSMAGFAVDANGTPLIFVALADRVVPIETLAARDLLDHIGAALTTCRCSRGGFVTDPPGPAQTAGGGRWCGEGPTRSSANSGGGAVVWLRALR